MGPVSRLRCHAEWLGRPGGWGKAAPRLTFQDRDNRVKINPQAPVAELASLLHSSDLSSLWGQKRFLSGHAGPVSVPPRGEEEVRVNTLSGLCIHLQEGKGFPPSSALLLMAQITFCIFVPI